MKNHIYATEPPEWARPYYRKTPSVALGFHIVVRRTVRTSYIEDITVIGSHVGLRSNRKRRTWTAHATREDAIKYVNRLLAIRRDTTEILGPFVFGIDARSMQKLKQSGELPSHLVNHVHKLALTGTEVVGHQRGGAR